MESERDTTVKDCMCTICGALMFFLGGIGALAAVWYFAMVDRPQEEVRREQWLRVPAQLETCFVKHTSGGGRHNPSRRTVHATYSYIVDGQRYESADLGSYHHEQEMMLQACSGFSYNGPATKSPEGLTCFVNPENPQEAKLFLEPSGVPLWGYLLAALLSIGAFAFGSVGIRDGFRNLKHVLAASRR